MKRLFYLPAILAFGLIFSACQKDDFSSEAQFDAKMKAAAATSFTFDAEAEACVGVEVDFTFEAPVGTNLQLQYESTPGVWIQIGQISKSVENPTIFSYAFPNAGTFNLRYKIGSGGFSDGGFIVVDYCGGCENLLETELVCEESGSKTLTVTFTAAAAGNIVIQGGLTNATTIIESATSDQLTRNTTHPGVVNSNANVTRWEGYVEACDEVTITIVYTGGNGVGDWTAKRGEETLGTAAAKECGQ